METPLVFLLFICSALSVDLPSYIKTCGPNDPKLNECVVKNGRAAISHFIHGDPKYGVPELDPFIIKELKIRQGSPQVGLNLVLTNLKLYGLGKVDFYKANLDLKNKHIEWYFKSKPGVKLIGPYKASGKVLLLPITGEGTANITLTDISFSYKYDYTLTKKKGKEYMKLEKTDLAFDVGGAQFHLENLFNGDKLLGDNMNRFLNENWKELVKTFGPEMGKSLDDVFNHLLSSIIGLVPFDVAFADPKA